MEGLTRFKQAILRAAKKAYREKLMAGTSGNMSVFFPERKWMIITPSSYDYEIMEEKDIVVTDLEGNVIEGCHRPSSEWRMHAEIYRHLPHVGAVVHTHSPYATSFAVNHQEIPVVLIEMIPFLKGKLEVSPYAKQGSAQVGLNAVPILTRKNACLMANHGVVAVGDTIESAYMNSVYVEDTAKIYHMAVQSGTPVVIPGYEE
ncbi:MAG: class II aldolase/adducin family protein [Lachnospiraceae bacterium]|jgi:ribulose-5-phosphate 4-epimerase/fuculose-1-phosphate aldolase|nr:class II aldolase/adducin family protein [Lachnospiraceae bacterium]